MNVSEALKSINGYPVPSLTIETIAISRGLDTSETVTKVILDSRQYNLAKADVLLWLSTAPQVSQGGISYNFTDEQRLKFRNEAMSLFDEYGEESPNGKMLYGYKGSRL